MTVTHARLMPPGVSLRSALELYGEAGEHAHVTIWYGMRGICSALKQAGFAVEHRHVWLPPRGEWPPLTTKVRFRQSGDAPEGPSIDPQGRSTVLATTTANETLPMWWAGLVFMTWGLFAWMPFTYAATRTGYKRWRGWAIAYGAAAIGALGLAALGHAAGGALRALDWLPLGLLAIGSFVHILAIRDEYSRRLASRRDPSLQLAQRQADLVQEARRLVAADPARARTMGIGRPDVQGSFDAGLVDINHASASALAVLPGFDSEIAARIIELRSGGRGFSSLADLDLVLDLPQSDVQALRDKVVFVPRD